MRSPGKTKAIRTVTGIIALMMLVVVLFSAFFVAAEAGHHCCGEDCHICACVRQCKSTLRSFSTGGAARSYGIASAAVIILAVVFLITAVSRETLISKKVRLDN